MFHMEHFSPLYKKCLKCQTFFSLIYMLLFFHIYKIFLFFLYIRKYKKKYLAVHPWSARMRSVKNFYEKF